jgi:hypothetical protein
MLSMQMSMYVASVWNLLMAFMFSEVAGPYIGGYTVNTLES